MFSLCLQAGCERSTGSSFHAATWRLPPLGSEPTTWLECWISAFASDPRGSLPTEPLAQYLAADPDALFLVSDSQFFSFLCQTAIGAGWGDADTSPCHCPGRFLRISQEAGRVMSTSSLASSPPAQLPWPWRFASSSPASGLLSVIPSDASMWRWRSTCSSSPRALPRSAVDVTRLVHDTVSSLPPSARPCRRTVAVTLSSGKPHVPTLRCTGVSVTRCTHGASPACRAGQGREFASQRGLRPARDPL